MVHRVCLCLGLLLLILTKQYHYVLTLPESRRFVQTCGQLKQLLHHVTRGCTRRIVIRHTSQWKAQGAHPKRKLFAQQLQTIETIFSHDFSPGHFEDIKPR
jgi:hypothetical protein